jgi:hypothetical protein
MITKDSCHSTSKSTIEDWQDKLRFPNHIPFWTFKPGGAKGKEDEYYSQTRYTRFLLTPSQARRGPFAFGHLNYSDAIESIVKTCHKSWKKHWTATAGPGRITRKQHPECWNPDHNMSFLNIPSHFGASGGGLRNKPRVLETLGRFTIFYCTVA